MTPAIQTSRLVFRYFTVEDFDEVHAYGADPVVTRYTLFGPNTVEQTKEFLERVTAESSVDDGAKYSFALIHKEANKLIGSCGLVRSDTNGPQYSLGYVFNKDWWRQGLCTEATAALVSFGFGELGAHRLWAHVFLGNTASERVLQKLGFRYEGCALKSMFVREAWHDVQTFAMLRSEWQKRVS